VSVWQIKNQNVRQKGANIWLYGGFSFDMKLYTCMNFSWNCVLKNTINIQHNTTQSYPSWCLCKSLDFSQIDYLKNKFSLLCFKQVGISFESIGIENKKYKQWVKKMDSSTWINSSIHKSYGTLLLHKLLLYISKRIKYILQQGMLAVW
jgi:hypothetical protein